MRRARPRRNRGRPCDRAGRGPHRLRRGRARQCRNDAAARDGLDAQIRDLEERIRTSRGSVDEAEARRMTDEYSRRITDAADEYSRRIVDGEGGDAERN